MKYSKWIQGKRAIRKVPLPLTSRPAPGAGDVPELGEPPEPPMVGLRVLTPGEAVEVLEFAVSFAESHGSKDPKPEDPLYDYGIALKTVELAAVDPDSDPKNPEPFFDGGVEQILNSQDIGQDGVLFLGQLQRNWQALCGPQAETLSKEAVEKAAETLAGPGGLAFFEHCGPALQWNLVRSMASLLSNLPILRLLSSSSSSSDTSSTSSDSSTNETQTDTESTAT